jgi:hypothetical protein
MRIKNYMTSAIWWFCCRRKFDFPECDYKNGTCIRPASASLISLAYSLTFPSSQRLSCSTARHSPLHNSNLWTYEPWAVYDSAELQVKVYYKLQSLWYISPWKDDRELFFVLPLAVQISFGAAEKLWMHLAGSRDEHCTAGTATERSWRDTCQGLQTFVYFHASQTRISYSVCNRGNFPMVKSGRILIWRVIYIIFWS